MKKTNHLLSSLLVACCMLLMLLPVSALAAEKWDGSVDTTWYNETSTEFKISDAADLAGLAQLVNSGTDFSGKTIHLTADIDLGSQEWTPIGNGSRSGSSYEGNAFKGIFDGGGKTITGLKITSGSGDTAIGLFGVVAGGTVQNLTLTDVKIACSDNECAGGVAGLMVNDAVVSGCEVDGSISIQDGAGGIVGRMVVSGTISGCTNKAEVTCTAGGAAGIVGKAYYTQQDKTMTIENCTNNGVITNSAYHAGGISALCAANVTNCTNNSPVTAGNTAGGIVAEQVNWGTVSGCTNTAEIKGGNNAGGIIGWVRYQNDTTSYAKSEKISVLNNTNRGIISTKTENKPAGGLGWGGIVGTVYNAGVVSGNKNTAPFITGGTFAAGIVGNLQENEGNLFSDKLAINVENNTSATPLASITVDGNCKDLYAYNNNSGTFAVKNNNECWAAQVGETQYQTLALAIAAVNKMEGTDPVTITLLDDVTETLYHIDSYPSLGSSTPDNSLWIMRANVTVDLNNHTLTTISSSGSDYEYLNFFASGGTVKNGSIIAKTQGNNDVSYVLGAEAQDANLTVTDVKTAGGIGAYSSITATIGGDATDIKATGSYAIRADNGAKVIITGGSYRAKETSNGYIFKAGKDSSIEISGGYFSGKQIFSGEGTLHITGGTFTQDPSAYVDNACIVKRDGANSYTYTVLKKADLTDGTYLSDPTGFTAPDYDVTKNTDGTWTVYYSASSGGDSSDGGPGSSDGSSSGSTSETVTNPDGSNTTTVTHPDGSTTETTKNPDGSTEVVETAKDGTVTTTTTDADGNKTEVAEKTDGSSQTTITNKDGSSSVTTADETGKTETEVELPDAVVNDAADKGETVALPAPAVSATADAETAPTVTVTLPGSSTSAKVEIPVKNMTTSTVAVLVNKDGTEEILKTTIPTENGVTVTLSDGDTVKILNNIKEFDDVADSHWASDAIAFTTSRELFAGTSTDTFDPESDMTRAMVMTVLARYEGVDTSTSDTWYAASRDWAIANGVSDGSNPDESVTREQLVTMLYRYAGKPEVSGSVTDFADTAQISDWAQDAMLWATQNGLLVGVSSDWLAPQGTATRAQVTAILMRFVMLTA